MKEISKTYDEWNEIGLSPYLGPKHTGRRPDGTCTFTLDQVGIKNKELFESARLKRSEEIDNAFNKVMRQNIRELQKDMRHD